MIVIRVSGGPDDLHRELLQVPNVHEARIIGEEVEIRVDGHEDSHSDILTHLVGKGFRILDFRQRQVDPRRRFHDRDEGRSAVNRVFAFASAAGDRINPVAVKEFRQAVQSRWVTAVFMLFLLLNLCIIGGYLMLSPNAATSIDGGRDIFMFLEGILFFTCLGFIPLFTGARLSIERNDTNIDLFFHHPRSRRARSSVESTSPRWR